MEKPRRLHDTWFAVCPLRQYIHEWHHSQRVLLTVAALHNHFVFLLCKIRVRDAPTTDQITYSVIRRSSGSPRPPCDGTPLASVWALPRQTPGLSCPYSSDRLRLIIARRVGILLNHYGFPINITSHWSDGLLCLTNEIRPNRLLLFSTRLSRPLLHQTNVAAWNLSKYLEISNSFKEKPRS